jgi:hypothetical protein
MKNFTGLVMLLTFFLINKNADAQNLVPNWSFEDTVSCPNYYNQITKASGWISFRNTPDYYNSCANTYVGIPFNDAGYQFTRNGEGYAGLITYGTAVNYREYIGIQLIQPLIIGDKYYMTFYVCAAISAIHTGIATNKIGARLFTQSHSQIQQVAVDNFAHVYSDSLISDTINWIKITGSIIADSAYEYIGIGNFFQDSLTTHIALDSTAALSYYYIDDVFLSTDSTLAEISEFAIKDSDIKLFPNPAINFVIVEGKNILSISLYDILGREIEDVPVGRNQAQCKIDMTNYGKGIYFIRLCTTKKNIIQKVILLN